MFFAKFPLLSARVHGVNVTIEDFFARIAPGRDYQRYVNAMTPYFVREDQRMEDVAFELYGNPTYHWVVFLCNNIINPFSEWPVPNEVLIKQVFDHYLFNVRVSADHGLVVGDRVQSSTKYDFDVIQVATENVWLRSRNGVAYLTIEDSLYNIASTTRPPIRISAVDDPLTTIHHYEDIETGYWVDYDVDLLAQGIIRAVSNIDYETAENDKKRAIRVLEKRHLSEFVQLFDREISS